MSSIGLVTRDRLRWMPKHLRIAHEYCYFLHDGCARLLREYEVEKAGHIEVKLKGKEEGKAFTKLAKSSPIEALRRLGYANEAKRLILNQLTMALTSDFLHHVFEGLRCFERRKIVVAFNVLRKPLKDNLAYLSWIVADANDFYKSFTNGNPEDIAPKLGWVTKGQRYLPGRSGEQSWQGFSIRGGSTMSCKVGKTTTVSRCFSSMRCIW